MKKKKSKTLCPMLRDSSSNVSSSKSKRSEIKSEISEERKSSSNKKVEGPKFISVKAGRLKNKKKRKRYRYGPKKGEIIRIITTTLRWKGIRDMLQEKLELWIVWMAQLQN